MRMKVALAGACFLAALLPSPVAAGRPECRGADLKLVLRLNQQRYTIDEKVRMKMTVINEGPRCTMVWSNGQRHSFYVFEGDRRIWDASACMGFTDALIYEDWERGHREVYRARWGQWENDTDNGDCERRARKAGPGRYRAQGHFMGDGEPKTSPLRFRVVR